MQGRKGKGLELAQRLGRGKTTKESVDTRNDRREGAQLVFVDKNEVTRQLHYIKRELLQLFGYTPIPVAILCGPLYSKENRAGKNFKKLTDTHKAILIILRTFAYGKHYCFPSNRSMSKIIGKDLDYVKKMLRDLDNVFSLISRSERFSEDGGQTSNITSLKPLDEEWVRQYKKKLNKLKGKSPKNKEFRSEHEDPQSTFNSIGIDNLLLLHYAGLLSPSAYITLCLIIVLHKMAIYDFNGYDLADLRGVGKSTIYRDLDEIEKVGLIQRIPSGNKRLKIIRHKYPSLEIILDYSKKDIKYIQALSKIIDDIPGEVLLEIFGESDVDEIISGLICLDETVGSTRKVPNTTPPTIYVDFHVPNTTPPKSHIRPPKNNPLEEEPIFNNVNNVLKKSKIVYETDIKSASRTANRQDYAMADWMQKELRDEGKKNRGCYVEIAKLCRDKYGDERAMEILECEINTIKKDGTAINPAAVFVSRLKGKGIVDFGNTDAEFSPDKNQKELINKVLEGAAKEAEGELRKYPVGWSDRLHRKLLENCTEYIDIEICKMCGGLHEITKWIMERYAPGEMAKGIRDFNKEHGKTDGNLYEG